jgi:hypothetical protein
MLDHLFDIDGNAKTAFEKVDFAAQEIRLDGTVIWHRKHGVAPLDDFPFTGDCSPLPVSARG